MARKKQVEVSMPDEAIYDEPYMEKDEEPVVKQKNVKEELNPGEYIREVNGNKYLAYTDSNGVSYDIKKL